MPRITEAIEKPSKRGNDMIELTIIVPDADGNERTLRDWLTDSTLGAAKLRHAAEADPSNYRDSLHSRLEPHGAHAQRRLPQSLRRHEPCDPLI